MLKILASHKHTIRNASSLSKENARRGVPIGFHQIAGDTFATSENIAKRRSILLRKSRAIIVLNARRSMRFKLEGTNFNAKFADASSRRIASKVLNWP
jgi:hypothetical protein